MPKITAFEKHTSQYEAWFEENKWVYQAELKAVKSLIPSGKQGVEIGVGTGKFAAPLNIAFGVEPSPKMGKLAKELGIIVVRGIAEALPFKNQCFDFALLVTTICFVDNLKETFAEAYRVLHKGDFLIIGFVDKNTPIGQMYLAHQHESAFYKEATFFSTQEVLTTLKKSNFGNFRFKQTIFRPLSDVDKKEPVKEGYSEGSFVVIRAQKL